MNSGRTLFLVLLPLLLLACDDDGSTDALPAVVDAGPEAGIPDMGFAACTTTADCPQGLACEYWSPGCDLQGECRPPLVAMDAFFSCFGICDCDGFWQGNAYTDFPFQRRDFDHGAPCLPPDLDGGVWNDPRFARRLEPVCGGDT